MTKTTLRLPKGAEPLECGIEELLWYRSLNRLDRRNRNLDYLRVGTAHQGQRLVPVYIPTTWEA